MGLMKKNYFYGVGIALVLLATSCGPAAHRYNCGTKRRCISYNQVEKVPVKTPHTFTKNA